MIYLYKIAILHHGMQSFRNNRLLHACLLHARLLHGCDVTHISSIGRFATSISLREHANERYVKCLRMNWGSKHLIIINNPTQNDLVTEIDNFIEVYNNSVIELIHCFRTSFFGRIDNLASSVITSRPKNSVPKHCISSITYKYSIDIKHHEFTGSRCKHTEMSSVWWLISQLQTTLWCQLNNYTCKKHGRATVIPRNIILIFQPNISC